MNIKNAKDSDIVKFKDSDIEKIKDCDIAGYIGTHVNLKPKGSSLVGLCPFHNEKTPSFHIHKAKGIFHCFGCGEKGGIIQFAKKILNTTFAGAVKDIARVNGIKIENQTDDSEPQKREKNVYVDNGKPIATDILERAKQGKKTNLSTYLSSFFGESTQHISELYNVGALDYLKSFNPEHYVFSSPSYNGACVFPYQSIDNQTVPYAKIMSYSTMTGKRNKWIDKEGREVGAVQSVHKVLNLGEKPSEKCAFGWHLVYQYPNATICIVEAEKGAIGLQMFCEPQNFIFIACKAENEILQKLKERNVILIPDTGCFSDSQNKKGWDTLAKEHGFQCWNIDPRNELSKNYDIWDWITKLKSDGKAIEQIKKGLIKKLNSFISFDVFDIPQSKPIPTVIHGVKDEYLSQTLERYQIPIDLNLCTNILLDANTGTGKGRVIEMLSNLQKPLFILSPFENLTKQTAQRITDYTGKTCVAYCGNDKEDFRFNANCQIWCVTYASFPNLCKRIIHEHGTIGDYKVIIDEWHYFTSAANPAFMLSQLREVMRYVTMCDGFLAMSATPLPNAHPMFKNAKTLEVITPMPKPAVTVVETNDVFHAIVEMIIAEGGKSMVVMKSKAKMLDAIKSKLDEKGIKGYSDFNSDTKKDKHFQEIIETGFVGDDVDVLLTTPVLKEGIDIKNKSKVSVFFVGMESDPIDIKQGSNRFRWAIKNDLVNVFVMTTFKEKIETKPTVPPFDWERAMQHQIDIAKIQAQVVNDSPYLGNTDVESGEIRIVGSTRDAMIWKNNGVYEVDYLHVNNVVYEQYRRYVYHCEAAFKQEIEKYGFDYKGIIQYETAKPPKQETLEDESMKIFQDICNELESKPFEVSQILERKKKDKNETVRYICTEIGKVVKYYSVISDMITDLREHISKIKASEFSLMRKRCAVASLTKSEEYLRNGNNVITNYIFHIMKLPNKMFTSEELRDAYVKIAAKYKFTEHLAANLAKAQRINGVIKALEPFFEVLEQNKMINKVRIQFYGLGKLNMRVNPVKLESAISDLEIAPTENGLTPLERNQSVAPF